MKITGTATVAAPLPRVWEALQDPAVLARTIPGCHSLEGTGGDAYKMTVSAGIASIKGTYVGRVELAEPDPPRSFVLRAQGQGAPGTVDATVRVRLSEGEAGTRVDYDADAIVGGMIGGVGQRVLGSVARKTAGEFFAAVERSLAGPEVAVATPAPPAEEGTPEAAAPGAAAPVYPGTASEPRSVCAAQPASAVPVIAAFCTGGAMALAGVVVGYALGRRARDRRPSWR